MLSSHAGHQEFAGGAPKMNVRILLHAGVEEHKWGIHPGFETTARLHQKSKRGVSEAPQRGLIYFKNFDLKCIEVYQTLIVTAEEISKSQIQSQKCDTEVSEGSALNISGAFGH